MHAGGDARQCAAVAIPGEPSASGFSERDFYLQEFRGRTLAIACPVTLLRDPSMLASVVGTLARNGIRVLVLSSRRAALEAVVGDAVLPVSAPALETDVWRALRETSRVGLLAGGRRPFARQCRDVVLRLGVFKLVWIDPGGGFSDRRGNRLSFVHRDELRELLAGRRRLSRRRRALLREIDALVTGGVPAVNVCDLAGLEEELFTYAGSGTLFTRKRYVAVRELGLDDFDAAHDLIARGVAEGFLAPRPSREVDRILAHGFGAFVEGAHLAGIGALLTYRDGPGAGEIASLYTLTRFLGEGVGQHLVRFALRRARELRLRWVFACTTQPRVGAFFARQGFEPTTPDALPRSRWRGYDRRRRGRLLCFRREVRRARVRHVEAGNGGSEPA
jgi:N-acetylglutamate synthase-like GNAT family acetyltransferase